MGWYSLSFVVNFSDMADMSGTSVYRFLLY